MSFLLLAFFASLGLADLLSGGRAITRGAPQARLPRNFGKKCPVGARPTPSLTLVRKGEKRRGWTAPLMTLHRENPMITSPHPPPWVRVEEVGPATLVRFATDAIQDPQAA